MKTVLKSAMLLLGLLVLANTASALIVSGEIISDYNGDGFFGDLSVDQIYFDVTAGTTVQFDVLAFEELNDLNGDGEITQLDPQLMLFSGNSLLASNDDSGSTFSDGSESILDSWLSYTFASAGTYWVSIGEFPYSTADALQGFSLDGGRVRFTDHADWQLTLTPSDGSLSNVLVNGEAIPHEPVPEPATMTLLGLGLAGLVMRRKKH
jgi:hypothetical protein